MEDCKEDLEKKLFDKASMIFIPGMTFTWADIKYHVISVEMYSEWVEYDEPRLYMTLEGGPFRDYGYNTPEKPRLTCAFKRTDGSKSHDHFEGRELKALVSIQEKLERS